MKLLRIINVDFEVTDKLPIRLLAFIRYSRKNGTTMRQYISYSQISRERIRVEGRIVQYSHRVQNPHEISPADH
jgi:hypothetical protein